MAAQKKAPPRGQGGVEILGLAARTCVRAFWLAILEPTFARGARRLGAFAMGLCAIGFATKLASGFPKWLAAAFTARSIRVEAVTARLVKLALAFAPVSLGLVATRFVATRFVTAGAVAKAIFTWLIAGAEERFGHSWLCKGFCGHLAFGAKLAVARLFLALGWGIAFGTLGAHGLFKARAIVARRTLGTRCTVFARGEFAARLGLIGTFVSRSTLCTGCTVFTRSALFTWGALRAWAAISAGRSLGAVAFVEAAGFAGALFGGVGRCNSDPVFKLHLVAD